MSERLILTGNAMLACLNWNEMEMEIGDLGSEECFESKVVRTWLIERQQSRSLPRGFAHKHLGTSYWEEETRSFKLSNMGLTQFWLPFSQSHGVNRKENRAGPASSRMISWEEEDLSLKSGLHLNGNGGKFCAFSAEELKLEKMSKWE